LNLKNNFSPFIFCLLSFKNSFKSGVVAFLSWSSKFLNFSLFLFFCFFLFWYVCSTCSLFLLLSRLITITSSSQPTQILNLCYHIFKLSEFLFFEYCFWIGFCSCSTNAKLKVLNSKDTTFEFWNFLLLIFIHASLESLFPGFP
jgi:hypothetical protein